MQKIIFFFETKTPAIVHQFINAQVSQGKAATGPCGRFNPNFIHASLLSHSVRHWNKY